MRPSRRSTCDKSQTYSGTDTKLHFPSDRPRRRPNCSGALSDFGVLRRWRRPCTTERKLQRDDDKAIRDALKRVAATATQQQSTTKQQQVATKPRKSATKPQQVATKQQLGATKPQQTLTSLAAEHRVRTINQALSSIAGVRPVPEIFHERVVEPLALLEERFERPPPSPWLQSIVVTGHIAASNPSVRAALWSLAGRPALSARDLRATPRGVKPLPPLERAHKLSLSLSVALWQRIYGHTRVSRAARKDLRAALSDAANVDHVCRYTNRVLHVRYDAELAAAAGGSASQRASAGGALSFGARRRRDQAVHALREMKQRTNIQTHFCDRAIVMLNGLF